MNKVNKSLVFVAGFVVFVLIMVCNGQQSRISYLEDLQLRTNDNSTIHYQKWQECETKLVSKLNENN